MGKRRAPAAPDPKQVASTQFSGNIGSTLAGMALGNINQITPYGSLRTMKTGNNPISNPFTGATINLPQYTTVQSLSPSQQALLDQQNANQHSLARFARQQIEQLGKHIANPLDISSLPAVTDVQTVSLPSYRDFFPKAGNSGDTYATADSKRYEDAVFGRLEPLLNQDRQTLETKLANQGLAPGSVAWDRAVDEANRAANDARLAAILKAGQEQSRVENLQSQRTTDQNRLASEQFNNNLAYINAQWQQRQQRMQEAYANRNQPIQEVLSLLQMAEHTSTEF